MAYQKIEVLSVGKPFEYALPVENGAIAEFLRPSFNRLFIALPNINLFERMTLQTGTLGAKLHYCEDTSALIIIFTFFGLGILDFDCPFDASLIGDLDKHRLSFDEEIPLCFEIVAVDSKTKELVAYRQMVMPKDMSSTFLAIASKQLSTDYCSTQAWQWVRHQKSQYTPEQMGDFPIQLYRFDC